MIIFGKTKQEWKQVAYNNSDYIICFVIGFILGVVIW